MDILLRNGDDNIEIPIRFEIYPDAVDPDQTIVSVKRIRALERDMEL